MPSARSVACHFNVPYARHIESCIVEVLAKSCCEIVQRPGVALKVVDHKGWYVREEWICAIRKLRPPLVSLGAAFR